MLPVALDRLVIWVMKLIDDPRLSVFDWNLGGVSEGDRELVISQG